MPHYIVKHTLLYLKLLMTKKKLCICVLYNKKEWNFSRV